MPDASPPEDFYSPITEPGQAVQGQAESRLRGDTGGDGILLIPGHRPLPEYELVRQLGKGASGEVWKATGPGGISVALKFIQLGEQAGQVELRSLEVMKNIRHAHLLTLFGVWERAGFLII